MKKIVCELCDSAEFAKTGGMFVCQGCGTKYTLEEAKVLMQEDKDSSGVAPTTSASSVSEEVEISQDMIEKANVRPEVEVQASEEQAELNCKKSKKRAKLIKIIAIIATPVICVAIAFIIALIVFIIPNSKYNDAIALMDQGTYAEAILAFEALDGYKDSVEKIRECNAVICEKKYNDAMAFKKAGTLAEAYNLFMELGEYKDSVEIAGNIRLKKTKEQLKNAKVGEFIIFGTYEQNNRTTDGKEDISWRVLEVKGGKALLISQKALDFKEFNTNNYSLTWETCSLRDWLNKDFINTAFTAEEKTMIPTVTLPALNNAYDDYTGNATKDKVFLLSADEAMKYFAYADEDDDVIFNSDDARKCEPTAYAEANGAERTDIYCKWLLRSPSYLKSTVDSVGIDGKIDWLGLNTGDGAIRPALWIDISKIK